MMKFIFLFIALFISFSLHCQRIRNVRNEIKGELMYISYDLEECPDSVKRSHILISYEQIYSSPKEGNNKGIIGNVTTAVGDINKYITCGKNKSVIWEYQKDIMNGRESQIELYPFIKQAEEEESISLLAKNRFSELKMGDKDKDFTPITEFRGRYLPPQTDVYVLSIGTASQLSHNIYAENDAALFAKYAEVNLSIARENVSLLLNPDSALFIQNIKRLALLAKAMQGKATFLIYFSGENIVEQDKMYLLLNDGGYALQEMYAELTQFPLNRVAIVLETDFSITKEEMIVPDKKRIKENLAVFCAASPEEENLPIMALEYNLFTYSFLKNIRDTYNNVAYREVFSKTKDFVSKKAIYLGEKSQMPIVYSSAKTGASWKSWNFLK